MFWHSVFLGFDVLLHWETWIAIVISTLLSTSLLIFSKKLLESEKYSTVGCLAYLITSLFECFLLTAVVVFLLPILFGYSYADLHLKSFNTKEFFEIAGGLTVFYLLVSLIPGIGSLLTQHYTIAIFVTGVIFVRFCIGFIGLQAKSFILIAPWWPVLIFGCLAVLINIVGLAIAFYLQAIFDKIFARFIQNGYVYLMKTIRGPETTWRSTATSAVIAKASALIGVGMYAHYCLMLQV